jgi:DDE superfamily endonuclease
LDADSECAAAAARTLRCSLVHRRFHSVGVHHQYCGQLGKQANCQVAVTLSIANHHACLPIAYRLYLPREWINDRSRRAAHVAQAAKPKRRMAVPRKSAESGHGTKSLRAWRHRPPCRLRVVDFAQTALQTSCLT